MIIAVEKRPVILSTDGHTTPDCPIKMPSKSDYTMPEWKSLLVEVSL